MCFVFVFIPGMFDSYALENTIESINSILTGIADFLDHIMSNAECVLPFRMNIPLNHAVFIQKV